MKTPQELQKFAVGRNRELIEAVDRQHEFMRDHRPLDNTRWYKQGRADQRRIDRIVAIVCLIVLVIYITWK